jgi:hypothetical protein
MRALEELCGEPVALSRLEALKFHHVLLPGDAVRLTVERDPGAGRFRFLLADPDRPDRVFASGRGTLGEDDDAEET